MLTREEKLKQFEKFKNTPQMKSILNPKSRNTVRVRDIIEPLTKRELLRKKALQESTQRVINLCKRSHIPL